MIKLKSLFRRGQGSPSSAASSGSASSKNTHQITPSPLMKSSVSASNLDQLDGASGSSSGKLSKPIKHSSKDKLNELMKTQSKEKLMDEKKEFKKQQKLLKQAGQQPQNLQMGTSNLVEMRAPSKEFIDIAFDGPKEVRIFKYRDFMQEMTILPFY